MQKSLSQGNLFVPGVGTYELRKDSYFDVPCFKFDKEKRENLNINHSALKYPGPGKYNDEIDKNSTMTAKWTFTKDDRFRKGLDILLIKTNLIILIVLMKACLIK